MLFCDNEWITLKVADADFNKIIAFLGSGFLQLQRALQARINKQVFLWAVAAQHSNRPLSLLAFSLAFSSLQLAANCFAQR